MIQQISDSELELMKIIWSGGGAAFYAQIMEELAGAGRTWQKNTVITLLSRLTAKGFLRTGKVGRRNQYIALVSEGDYRAEQTQKLLNRLYEGDARGLVATLIQGNMLPAEDCKALKEFWEREKEDR